MTNFDEHIEDREYYNSEMQKSLIDKAFFLDKVDADVFIDYGCADGALINFIKRLFPDTVCIGYDISQEELDLAIENNPGSKFFNDWDELMEHVNSFRNSEMNVAIICNSLIHEVYAYGDDKSVATFWDQIFGNEFDTIIIRDMCVSENVNRRSDPVAVARIRQKYDQTMLREFEAQWGIIDNNWSLTHFLLKYRYERNWEREVKENYLPLNLEDLLAKIPANYRTQFVDHFVLPFIRKKARKDFMVDMTDSTHVKLILEKIVPGYDY